MKWLSKEVKHEGKQEQTDPTRRVSVISNKNLTALLTVPPPPHI